MVTYALLGATGSTGSAIIRSLISKPPLDLQLNILVRSPDKLRKQFPDIDTTSAVKSNIIHGTPSDKEALRQWATDADVVFSCIGTNECKAGMSIVEDTAKAIRNLSVNETMRGNMPFIGRNIASFCFHYAYTDIERACDVFDAAKAETPDLLTSIWVDPPSIHDPDGTTPTGYALLTEGEPGPMVSYADLGAAFCELAERRKEFLGKAVEVHSTGEVNETWDILKGYMWIGAKSRIFG